MNPPAESTWVSVLLVCYNSSSWLPRCLESLRAQTIFDRIEVIIVDNASPEDPEALVRQLTAGWTNAVYLQTGANLGFCGANRGAAIAKGKYLYLLNPDVWLEPDCLEQFYRVTERAQAGGAGGTILEFDDDTLQARGCDGFDFCGYAMSPDVRVPLDEIFCFAGFYFVRKDLYEKVGMLDEKFFLYGEELDLSWRILISGEKLIAVTPARVHHRGAVAVNPKGGTKMVEIRTTDSKRYYANRNHLLTLLKNAQHLLLLLLLPALALMMAEALLGVVMLRRGSFFTRSFVAPLRDCWRWRDHIRAERRRIRSFRRRGDWWMLRFFRFRFNRWADWKRMWKLGLPKVEAR